MGHRLAQELESLVVFQKSSHPKGALQGSRRRRAIQSLQASSKPMQVSLEEICSALFLATLRGSMIGIVLGIAGFFVVVAIYYFFS